MVWTEWHGKMLKGAFELVLGYAERGAMAFVRCLTPGVVEQLARDNSFAPQGWKVWRVAASDDAGTRTLSADSAVEQRETKGDAILLLVDTDRAGAGMDGIYSAAREVGEASLFKESRRLAAAEVRRQTSRKQRQYAELALKRARRYGGQYTVSPWTEFDFLCRIAAHKRHPGAYLHLLGLWPIAESEGLDLGALDVSRRFVNHLLGTAASGLSMPARIESLRLAEPADEQRRDLERFLQDAETRPLLPALERLTNLKDLWVGELRVESAHAIQSIELSSWRNRNGKIAQWSGLTEESETGPPVLVLKPGAVESGDYSKLEVKWKAQPGNLEKNAVDYRVAILTGLDEELAARDLSHSARKEEKCRFSNDDFSSLNEDALLSAKAVVSVLGNDAVEQKESEEFIIRFGKPPEKTAGGVGKKVRAFSEGLIELDDRENVSTIADRMIGMTVDAKGFVLLRVPQGQQRKSFRVFRPPLIHEVEKQWIGGNGRVGRWRVKVRASGARAGEVEFVPMDGADEKAWHRVKAASSKMAQRFKNCGGVGQVYDDKSRSFEAVGEYLRAWVVLLNAGDPSLALCHTIEVQSLSGRTIGLIVLPAHPLRVAWLAAYDNLVLHTAFEQEQTVKDILAEFRYLDGALFPAFLPNPDGGAFVFADTLGFHAVGMVPDSDKEPKAAVAILARALGESESADTAPTVGSHSAKVLGNEIVKYLDSHDTSRLLHVHALRPGDGLTVAKSLGGIVHRHDNPDADDVNGKAPALAFSLELYPSPAQKGVAGRFIAESSEKRRRGAGVLSPEDHWMLESLSLPGGVNVPKLRWARKDSEDPDTAAHLAVAFDTFESCIAAENESTTSPSTPYHAFGLLSFYERKYTDLPSPLWSSAAPSATEGEKHPSRRIHTENLANLQNAIQGAVARHIGAKNARPVLRTEISDNKADSLRQLHRLCDWVITLDRNAGIEYFDSPRGNREIYDAYVIDCVPEREDLGCLQLVTSTSNLEEIHNLVDASLHQLGLGRSHWNAKFLLEHLKSLSGRLAIRLAGNKPPTPELVALAVSHANCQQAPALDDCWVSLEKGFIIPVDDIRDLLLRHASSEKDDEGKHSRPDLIYVSAAPRGGLVFRFIEVKCRRHLRAARAPEMLEEIRQQTQALRKKWYQWYGHEDICSAFRGIRRARLARVLRFYADKAHRHYLPVERYEGLLSEIYRMVEKGRDYALHPVEAGDRGWVFCPEYAGRKPLKISPDDWETQVFLFGPGLLPDSDFRPEMPAAEPIDLPSATHSSRQADEHARGVAESMRHESKTPVDEAEAPGEEVENAPPSICLGTDTITSDEVRWRLTVQGNPHLLIAGLPGMGKTTCLLNLCKQMAAANIRPVVFSYHQDIDERLEQSVNPVRFIDFDGLGFNPLQVVDRESRRAYLDVAGAMRDIFTAIYPELGDIQADRIRTAIKDSFIEAGWDASDAAVPGLREPEFNRFVDILRSHPARDRGLQSLLARLTELHDYGFFEGGKSRESLWESKQPVVIRIHKTQNETLQRAFSSLVFYGLYKDMFRRGIQERITHALIFDEAHRAAGLKLIPTMAKECRKYGISLVLASQEARDFNVSVFSAIANYLVLRLTEADAKSLVRNVSNSRHERRLMDKIKLMDRFKALYFREGRSNPYSVNLSP